MSRIGRGWRRWSIGAGLAVLLAVPMGVAFLGARPAGALGNPNPVVPASTPADPAPPTSVPSLPGGPPAGTTTVSDGTNGKVAGMAIPNVSEQQSPDEVARLRSDGLNTISLFVWWLMQDQNSNTLAPDYQDGITETDANLELQIATTEQAGMHVILVPIFYCEGCSGGWRGTIDPSDPTEWFASYQSFIDHYADIAQQYGATTLFVGSELSSMESYTTDWENVISVARTHFFGQIGYEENWDVLGNAKFLSDVDIIGVSAYFPLDSAKSPALSDLLGDWTSSHGQGYSGKNWVSELSQVAASTGKPILFGEVGYMSGDYAGNQPFLNYLSTTNWQLQSDLYQALLETFSDQSWWAGVVWWEWYLTPDTTSDNGRSPRGKTAEPMLQRWYKQGLRPPNPQTPLAMSLAAFSPDDSEIPRATATSGSGAGGGSAGGSGAARGGAGPTAGATSSGSGAAARSGQAGSSAKSGPAAAGATAGGAPTAAPAAHTQTSGMTGTRRALAIVAALALIAVVLALATVGAADRPTRVYPLRR